uniref:GH116 family glycosyl hydrolase n=1 Tax=Phaeodactylibacter xiamenensis TaxID=1524460 RepID=UPI0024A82B82
VKGGWDGDQDGVMEAVQHSTMDVEYFGPNPQMQFWYLGALKAMQKMAEHLGEDELANICQTLFTKGSRWTDENLFNGEYYIQQLQVPASMDEIANGLMAGMGSEDLQNPQYQLEEGCLIDQLVGQYMAHVLGLGYLGKPENMRKTLQSILKYNQRKTLFEHFNNMRSYALGDEKALLMVSYPKGGRPEVPFPYWSEVMTGFEYTAAVGMLYEGLETEGLEVIRNIRDRYDGSKRNPFDEAECGHHYTRAMASWAGILAQSGFKFSAVEQSMQFHPKTGKWFWSNGSAWGTCHISKENGDWVVDLMVLHGAFSLKSFQLGEDLQKHYNEVQTVGEGNRLTCELNTK